ncbi:MAG: hypothetical protein K6G13_06585 [Agathobacter sp.]|uniref:hypothetical protein n=1 Tax=Agathobacter sp. TaxID=2021311 RepID=UPI00258E3D3F|nr:hypothetical protein [Agathobacter sp.]MCR5677684.1 hypothetical protein [Agathobacter sp.]
MIIQHKIKQGIAMILAAVLLCSCALNDDESEKNTLSDGTMDEESSIITPEYHQTILTDLRNCDLVFTDEYFSQNFEVSLYSLEELDVNQIEVTFDSDIKYEVTVSEQPPTESKNFGYALLCAYNGIGLSHFGDYSDKIPLDGFQELLEARNIPAFYHYDVNVQINMLDESYADNLNYEITTMDVKYKNEHYSFDIGSIRFDFNERLHSHIGSLLAGEHSAYQKIGGLDYIPLTPTREGYFDSSVEECIVTDEEELTIDKISISGPGSVKLKEAEVSWDSDGTSMNVKYQEGESIVIPPHSTVSIHAIGEMEELTKQIGGYYAFTLDVGYRCKDTSGEMNILIIAKAYTLTPYELYAYDVDHIDILNMYLNKFGYKEQYE